jgi:hypothetical protein
MQQAINQNVAIATGNVITTQKPLPGNQRGE